MRQSGAGGNHVHHAADGVRPVEQRRRAAHDLDPLRLGGIHGDSLFGGLAADVSGAHAVFGDQHPVPVETPDDGTGGPGAETADRHPGRAFEQLGEARNAFQQIETLEGGHGPEYREPR